MASVEDLQAKMNELDKQKEEIAEQIRRLKPITKGELDDALKEFQDTLRKEGELMLEKFANLDTQITAKLQALDTQGGSNVFNCSRLSYSSFTPEPKPPCLKEAYADPKNTKPNDKAPPYRDLRRDAPLKD